MLIMIIIMANLLQINKKKCYEIFRDIIARKTQKKQKIRRTEKEEKTSFLKEKVENTD